MENKSIGKFISVLRKEVGMTQKELGDKLFVSDKTISRWEREDCSPEISLLPSIAEVFGVTTDELLRGERIVVEQPTSNSAVGVIDSDKQSSNGTQAQSEKKHGWLKVNKPLLAKIVAACGTIAILLAVGLIVLGTVTFTSADTYSTFNDLKNAVQSDYDQWIEANYGTDQSAIEQANKDKMCKDTMYIPDTAQGGQYVEYYYHKDHYIKISGAMSNDNKQVYVATRIVVDEVNVATIVLWSLFGANIVVAVTLYFVLANKKSKHIVVDSSDDNAADEE